jgi:hypothetical protein
MPKGEKLHLHLGRDLQGLLKSELFYLCWCLNHFIGVGVICSEPCASLFASLLLFALNLVLACSETLLCLNCDGDDLAPRLSYIISYLLIMTWLVIFCDGML